MRGGRRPPRVPSESYLQSTRHGPIFAPLRDPAYFARFRVDDTLVWPIPGLPKLVLVLVAMAIGGLLGEVLRRRLFR